MLTTDQIKAARVLLGWTQADLASRAGISTTAVWVSEHGRRGGASLARIHAALIGAGVIFTNGDEPGVKLRSKGEGGMIAGGDLNRPLAPPEVWRKGRHFVQIKADWLSGRT